MMNPRWLWAATVAAAIGVAVAALHAQPSPPAKPASAQDLVAVPVTTVAAGQRDVPETIDALGTVVPIRSVKLRPQVAGQLMSTRFKEGGKVAKGQLLAMVDSRELQAKLKQAQGILQRDLALRRNAQADLERYKGAVRDGSVTQQALDTQKSLVDQLDGSVLSDRGVIDELNVQIGFTRLRSPVAGRIGLRQIDAGNIVDADAANVIAVIDTVKPTGVVFTLPQERIQQVQRAWRENKTLQVLAYDRDKRRVLDRGKLLAIDNHVDPASGTVSLKATFPNEQGRLIANQFVNARLVVGILHDAVVVPAIAVRHGRGGDYLYTVGADGHAVYHRVERGPTVRDEVVVLASDVHARDVVVVDGADRLDNGVLVDAHPRASKARGAASGAAPAGDAGNPASASAGPPAGAASAGAVSDEAAPGDEGASGAGARAAAGAASAGEDGGGQGAE